MNVYARQGWEDRAAKLGTGFSIEKVAATYDEDVMRRARELHDVLFGAAPAWKSSAVAGTSTAEVGCAKAPLHMCVGGRVLSKAEAPRVPKRAAAAEHPDASASKFAKVKCFNCKASNELRPSNMKKLWLYFRNRRIETRIVKKAQVLLTKPTK